MSKRHTRLLRYTRRMGYLSRCPIRWCPECGGEPFDGRYRYEACWYCDLSGVVDVLP